MSFRALLLNLLFLTAFFISACSMGPYHTGNDPREPYPVEPQTVTVHFLSHEDFFDEFPQYPMANGYARINEDGSCELFFPANRGAPSRYTLSHELRHCIEGDFH